MQFTATVEPNEKYRHVINGEVDGRVPDTEAEYREQAPAPDAADAYLETMANAPTAEDIEADHEDIPRLSWSMIDVPSDPDLLSKLATYFDGIDADDPADLIRAKLRLVDVDVYAPAQVAAQAELRQ